MNRKTKSLVSLAVAGLVSGAFLAPHAFAGDKAEGTTGDKKEAKEKCGGENGCGAKTDDKNACKGEKNSCKGDKNECKAEKDKNACKAHGE